MFVYEAAGEALKRMGVEAVFGLLGDGNMRWMSHMAGALGIHYYAARHESGAVAMADGYARMTNRVGVCTVSMGPGVTNTVTAMVEAHKAGSPLLLLAGDTSPTRYRHNQDVDQPALFASLGIATHAIRSAETAAFDAALAFNRAAIEQRPVALTIPTEMQLRT
jgi:thiamine pyrophosphate-dependent acetolactate synthase large subunit-like protein